MALADAERVEVAARADLRAWLAAHHDAAEGVWLVTHKRPHPDYLPYDAIVEECLCFGWIDSLPRKLDATRTMLYIAPRKRGSNWSRVNKDRVARLVEAGLMAPPGEAIIEAARRDGSWSRLDAVEAGVVPGDLRAALDAKQGAAANFAAFPASARRGILEWLLNAKRPETRAERVAKAAAMAAANDKTLWRRR